jgi:7-cyano-7-deazaguanine synthase in queuosine biosynthesis
MCFGKRVWLLLSSQSVHEQNISVEFGQKFDKTFFMLLAWLRGVPRALSWVCYMQSIEDSSKCSACSALLSQHKWFLA